MTIERAITTYTNAPEKETIITVLRGRKRQRRYHGVIGGAAHRTTWF